MRVADYFRLAWGALWERRGRTIGAIVGIIIAIVALGLALGLGQGYRTLAFGFFERVFGTNTIFLFPGENSRLTLTNVYEILNIPHVTNAVPILATTVRVTINGHTVTATLMGVTAQELEQLYGVTSLNNALLSGAPLLTPGIALVGYNVAFTSTGQQIAYPGQVIVLTTPGGTQVTYTIGGVLQSSGIGIIGLNPNNAIFIDMNTFLAQFDPGGLVNGVIIYVDSPNNVNEVTNELKALFPMDQVLNLSTLLTSINQFFTVLELFLGFIAGISFVIIGIWIFDTMMISIIQRTREFGIMRAVGFSGRSIPILLIIESVIIALIGSAIGTALLAAIVHAIPQPTNPFNPRAFASSPSITLPIVVTPIDFAALFILPIAINILASLIPALRAMRIPPAQTLRYE
ncbi:ABC transporter permease [Vulcanisaeta thermophila]|uniref:ABC transporter permease n=1 Tax=Vulcanisaeta thermophila TaxID=867917 RepID=UPI000852C045|nr:FtsX-like permease family protein [Vulcanisaeta thermophila]